LATRRSDQRRPKRVRRSRRPDPHRSGIADFKAAGASGFVDRRESVREFLDTIRQVARGKEVVLLTGQPRGAKKQKGSRRDDGSFFGKVHLTDRERIVFSLIAAGLSKAQITRRLNIRLATLDRHLARILRQINESGQREQ